MEINDQLSLENDRLRRHLSLILSSLQHHQQFCSAPFLLSEQFHLDTFQTPDASTSFQVGSNSAEPSQAQFQIGSDPGTSFAAELLVQNQCVVKQNRSGLVNTGFHGDHGPNPISSVPFLLAEPFREDQFQEGQLDCFGQLRVIGLYANSTVD